MDTALAIKFAGALFAIMNPVSNLPVFMGLTEGMTAARQRSIARQVALYLLVMGGIIALAGNQILSLFGISINDFRVAGGLVVLLIGLSMLRGENNTAHHGTSEEKAAAEGNTDIAFYPLTFPILMGPGTITTVIVFTHQARTTSDWILIGSIFLGLVLAVAVVFSLAGVLSARLSHTARVIMTRLMGMILAAIAIDMIMTGLKALLPGLA